MSSSKNPKGCHQCTHNRRIDITSWLHAHVSTGRDGSACINIVGSRSDNCGDNYFGLQTAREPEEQERFVRGMAEISKELQQQTKILVEPDDTLMLNLAARGVAGVLLAAVDEFGTQILDGIPTWPSREILVPMLEKFREQLKITGMCHDCSHRGEEIRDDKEQRCYCNKNEQWFNLWDTCYKFEHRPLEEKDAQ